MEAWQDAKPIGWRARIGGIVNYSLNGVCLQTREPMELNRPYYLTLGEGPSLVHLRLQPLDTLVFRQEHIG